MGRKPEEVTEEMNIGKLDGVTEKSFTKPDKVTEQRDTKPDNVPEESRAKSRKPDEVTGGKKPNEVTEQRDGKSSKLDEVVSEERDTKGRKSAKKRNTNEVADTQGILISLMWQCMQIDTK